MSAQYLSCRVLSADQIGPHRNATISMGPMRAPTFDTDPATKKYVDDNITDHAVKVSNTAWMDHTFGSDSLGLVSHADRPFLRYNAAASAITGAAFDNKFIVVASAGPHSNPTLALRPFVNLTSADTASCLINTATVQLHPAFATTANATCSLSNVTTTELDLDLDTIGGANDAAIDCKDCDVSGNVNWNGRHIGDLLNLSRVSVGGSLTMIVGQLDMDDCMIPLGGTLLIDATLGRCYSRINLVRGMHLTITNTNSGILNTVYMAACTFNGTVTLNGTGVVVYTDKRSVSNASSLVIQNGASLNVIDYMMTSMNRLFTNDWSIIHNISGTLTAADLYNGPIRTSGIITLTLPSAANFISQLTAILGFQPPNGFNFTSQIFVTSDTLTLDIGGASYLDGTASMTIGAGHQMVNAVVWILDNAIPLYNFLVGTYT